MVATTKDKKKYKTIQKKVDKTVESPCTNVCKYDTKEEFCIGCYRTKQELQDWWIMTREQKLETLKKLEEREMWNKTKMR
ncbi:MAG: DUF1289 domain-containing protein [Alphaproteobacteria bacterium]|nr:DUF1289 domain-containing protein [Alphaproteobacteria bacterium]